MQHIKVLLAMHVWRHRLLQALVLLCAIASVVIALAVRQMATPAWYDGKSNDV